MHASGDCAMKRYSLFLLFSLCDLEFISDCTELFSCLVLILLKNNQDMALAESVKVKYCYLYSSPITFSYRKFLKD